MYLTYGWNLHCLIKVANPFSYNQNCPRGYLPLPLGYIYMYKLPLSLNFFETAWPMFTRFHIRPVEGVLSICSNSFASLKKMAAMPIYDKNTLKSSPELRKLPPASVAQLDAPSDWRPGGCGFNPRRGRQHSFVEIDHEIFSTVILSLPLIQEGQLSVSGETMCTILVNRSED